MDFRKIIQFCVVFLIGFNLWVWTSIFGSVYGENAVYFFDVGQGDAQLIVLSAENTSDSVKILIDGGAGKSILQSLDLVESGIRNNYIDILVMTHPHLDHFGGFVDILKNYEVGIFISNGHEENSESFLSLKSELERKNVLVLYLKEGAVINFDKTNLFIISPDDSTLRNDNLNEASIVIMMKYGLDENAFKILFTGDIGFSTENVLLKKYDLKADVLKVGHHGSKYSTGINFLSFVDPVVGIISVGKNKYGHPAGEVLELLKLAGVQVYRTDEAGTIKIVLDDVSKSGDKLNERNFFADVVAFFIGGYKNEEITTLYSGDLEKTEQESTLVPYQICSYNSSSNPTKKNLGINEVAWMGSGSGASHEWIELRNLTGGAVDLSGWQILNENERIKILFPQKSVFNKEYILLARNGVEDVLGIEVDLGFTGSIRNSKEGLRVFDNQCRLVDEVLAFPSWPAGNNTNKKTMELVSGKWVDSVHPGGTPGKRNTGSSQNILDNVSDSKSTKNSFVGSIKGCASDQININTASKNDLMKIRHIGSARADGIIENRPYVFLEELVKVAGIGEGRLSDIISEGKACVE